MPTPKLSRAAYELLSTIRYGAGIKGTRFYRTWRYKTPGGTEFSESTVQKLVGMRALASRIVKGELDDEIHFRITPKGEELEREYAATRGQKRERGG